MIRQELKIDPIGYVSKNILSGVELSNIERLYIINKCPQLFSYLCNRTKLDERLYLFKMRKESMDIEIESLQYRNNVKKALNLTPVLCANLDFNEYSEEINHAITKIKISDTLTFIKILKNETIDKDLIRKILILRPDLISDVKDTSIFNDDSDLQIHVFNKNPLLIEYFESIPSKVVLHIINVNISNVKYLTTDSVVNVDSKILSDLVNEYVILIGERGYDFNIVNILINGRQEVFTNLVREVINYGGFASYTINDIIIKRLLREFNNMIDDEVAELVVRGR